MKAPCLGFDTSNYTTSAAVFDGAEGHNSGRLLDVPEGALGLRQNDAVFQHVRRLPDMVAALRQEGWLDHISAVGASTRPRAVDESYMPCFLVGEGQGRTIADALGVPFFSCSHQQGHIAAAAWSAGREDLLDVPHLAWHLSGGTTELLFVTPEGGNVKAEKIGGTSDISAGQLVDRTGQLLGVPFPAGRALDALCRDATPAEGFPVKISGFTFSLSGMENKVRGMVDTGTDRESIAQFVFATLSSVLVRTTKKALEEYPGAPVLCSGGVASNSVLRRRLAEVGAIFAPPQYSTDNALGVAILTRRAMQRGELSWT